MAEFTYNERCALSYLARTGSFHWTELPTCYVRGAHSLVRKGLAEKRENDLWEKFKGVFSKWEFQPTDEAVAIGIQF